MTPILLGKWFPISPLTKTKKQTDSLNSGKTQQVVARSGGASTERNSSDLEERGYEVAVSTALVPGFPSAWQGTYTSYKVHRPPRLGNLLVIKHALNVPGMFAVSPATPVSVTPE